jgi:hypothetical protein
VISPNTANAAAEAIRRGHQNGMGQPPFGHDADDACEELARRVQAEGTVPIRLSPLDMAVNLAGRVQAYAEALNDPDPDRRLQATISQAGERAHTGAQLAANLAQVSIAQDLHALRRVMLGAADPDLAWPEEDGAVADARVTRDHMRSWAKGETTHPGEQP